MAGADSAALAPGDQLAGKSVRELRRLIASAGLSSADCTERPELVARAREVAAGAGGPVARVFNCPQCAGSFCLGCEATAHPGRSCAEESARRKAEAGTDGDTELAQCAPRPVGPIISSLSKALICCGTSIRVTVYSWLGLWLLVARPIASGIVLPVLGLSDCHGAGT